MNAESVLKQFVEAINATGGVQVQRKGLFGVTHYAPVADLDWIDLGEAYIEACRVINVEPKIVRNEDEQ